MSNIKFSPKTLHKPIKNNKIFNRVSYHFWPDFDNKVRLYVHLYGIKRTDYDKTEAQIVKKEIEQQLNLSKSLIEFDFPLLCQFKSEYDLTEEEAYVILGYLEICK